mgnify:FL=1
MKIIESRERSTGMGAIRYTAVLLDGQWVRMSEAPGHRYNGRDHGEECYEIDVADDAVTASFYRSNGGNEQVTASNGQVWGSFEAADRWAAGESTPATCPHCGRVL